MTALARELDGVRQEVAHDLLQARAIPRDPGRHGVDLELDGDELGRRRGREGLDGGAGDRLQVHGPALDAQLTVLAARDVDEVVDHGDLDVEAGVDGLDGARPQRVAHATGAERLDPHHHGRERRAQLVRDDGQEVLLEPVHALGEAARLALAPQDLLSPLVVASALRDVDEGRVAGGAALARGARRRGHAHELDRAHAAVGERDLELDRQGVKALEAGPHVGVEEPTALRRQQRAQRAPVQVATVLAEQRRAHEVELADDAVAVEGDVAHGRVVVELGVARERLLEEALRLAQRAVLQLELHLVDLELVHEAVLLVADGRGWLDDAQVARGALAELPGGGLRDFLRRLLRRAGQRGCALHLFARLDLVKARGRLLRGDGADFDFAFDFAFGLAFGLAVPWPSMTSRINLDAPGPPCDGITLPSTLSFR